MGIARPITQKLTPLPDEFPGTQRTLPPSVREIAARRSCTTTVSLPAPPGPHLSTRETHTDTRTQIIVRCDLAPPEFPLESILDMALCSYERAHPHEKPGYLYVCWLHVLDMCHRTGSASYKGIPLHVRKGVGFWSVVCTRYPLREEEE